MTSSLDFTHSSRKGWNIIRKLSSGQQLPSSTRPSVKPNAVVSHLVKVGKAPIEKQVKLEITKEWRAYRRRPLDEGTTTVTSISPKEVDTALKNMKCGKAPGYDNIHLEFLKNLGPRARKWLAMFLTRIVSEKNLPKSWRITKTVAIPKPGKDPKMASSYRPISLLSMCYKLLERIILHRISPAVDEILNIEQDGFRPGRSTQDQVLALTTYVENGYQRRDKTGVVFLDLTAAYDTVWNKGLLIKLSKVLPCWAVSPFLFCLYTTSISQIITTHDVSHHMYADDTQVYLELSQSDTHNSISSLSDCLTDISLWMKSGKLKLNSDKTEFIIIGTKQQRQKLSNHCPVKLLDNDISPSDSVRNLGVIFDSDFAFTNTFPIIICKSCFYHIRDLRRIRRHITLSTAKTISNALISSRLDYCNSLINNIAKQDLSKLQRVQNCLARVILRAPRFSPFTSPAETATLASC